MEIKELKFGHKVSANLCENGEPIGDSELSFFTFDKRDTSVKINGLIYITHNKQEFQLYQINSTQH